MNTNTISHFEKLLPEDLHLNFSEGSSESMQRHFAITRAYLFSDAALEFLKPVIRIIMESQIEMLEQKEGVPFLTDCVYAEGVMHKYLELVGDVGLSERYEKVKMPYLDQCKELGLL